MEWMDNADRMIPRPSVSILVGRGRSLSQDHWYVEADAKNDSRRSQIQRVLIPQRSALGGKMSDNVSFAPPNNSRVLKQALSSSVEHSSFTPQTLLSPHNE